MLFFFALPGPLNPFSIAFLVSPEKTALITSKIDFLPFFLCIFIIVL